MQQSLVYSARPRQVNVIREAHYFRTRGVRLGTDTTNGQPVYLSRKHLATHLHLCGPTGSGKTRVMFHLFKLLAYSRRPVILIDPKGGLYQMCRDWAISAGLTARLRLFDLSQDVLPGYNVLRPNGLSIPIQAKWVREGIKSAWGQTTFDTTPQLQRFLYLALAVAREFELGLVEAIEVLRPASALRAAVLPHVQDPFVHDALLAFDLMNPRRQEELAASTIARLESFVCDALIRTVVTSTESLDVEEALTSNAILLINAAKFQPILPDDMRLLLRLLVNDILAHVFKLHGEGTFHEHRAAYLLIDEVQNAATRQLCQALDEGRGVGLHCVLAHQFCRQLADEDQTGYLLHSVMHDARTKILFGDLDYEDLELFARNLMLHRFSPWHLKDRIVTPVFAPKETTRVVRGTSNSYSETEGISFPESVTEGESVSETHGTSRSLTEGESFATTEGRSRSISEGMHEMESTAHSLARTHGSALTEGEARTHAAGRNRSAALGRGTSSGSSQALGTSSGQGASTQMSASESQAMQPPNNGLLAGLLPQTPEVVMQYAGGATSQGMSTFSGVNSSSGAFQGSSENAIESRGVSEMDAATQSRARTSSEALTEGMTRGMSRGRSLAVQEGTSSAVTRGTSRAVQTGESHATTRGVNRSVTKGVVPSYSETETWGESETITPFHEYHEREIVSSRTYLTPEEQKLLHMQLLKKIPKAHFLVTTPESPACVVQAPWVETPRITRRRLLAGLKKIYALPYYVHRDDLEKPRQMVPEVLPAEGGV